MKASEQQPAIKSYYFGKGYRDLEQTIKESWQRNLVSASTYAEAGAEALAAGGGSLFIAVGAFFAAFSVIVFGTIFFLGISLFHILFLLSFFSIIYTCFSVVWIIEKGYRTWHGMFTACPVCHHKSDLPHYLCGNCGKAHTNLTTGSYGIFKRTCECGNKLPTTFFNGRSNLEARCPNPDCSRAIETKEIKPLCFPIIGGPSVGKTCCLFTAMQELIQKAAPRKHWGIRFLNQKNEQLYENLKRRYAMGIAPNKTTELNPSAFNFFIEGKDDAFKKVVYLYDAAGEAFENDENLIDHKFYSYLNGYIILIDPFSIQSMAAMYQAELAKGNVSPSIMDLEEVYDRMIINLEKRHNIKSSTVIKEPCAIIINKMDAMDLENRLGESMVAKYQSLHKIATLEEARNQLCLKFLKAEGMTNFANKINSKFKNYQFFTCSALAPDKTGKRFAPYRTSDALLWLLAQSDRHLR